MEKRRVLSDFFSPTRHKIHVLYVCLVLTQYNRQLSMEYFFSSLGQNFLPSLHPFNVYFSTHRRAFKFMNSKRARARVIQFRSSYTADTSTPIYTLFGVYRVINNGFKL